MEDALVAAKSKIQSVINCFVPNSALAEELTRAIEDIDTHIALAPWLRKPMPVEVLPPLSLDADESERKSRKVPTPKPATISPSMEIDF